MPDVGINFKVTEQMGSVAPTMVASMKSIGSAARDMKDALGVTNISEQWKAFADRVDTVQDYVSSFNRAQTPRPGNVPSPGLPVPGQPPVNPGQPGAGGGGGGYNGSRGTRFSNTIKGVGQVASQFGEGEVLGGVAQVGEKISGATAAIPGIGWVVAGLTATLTVLNAITSVYEKQLDTIMETTAQFGLLNKDAKGIHSIVL